MQSEMPWNYIMLAFYSTFLYNRDLNILWMISSSPQKIVKTFLFFKYANSTWIRLKQWPNGHLSCVSAGDQYQCPYGYDLDLQSCDMPCHLYFIHVRAWYDVPKMFDNTLSICFSWTFGYVVSLTNVWLDNQYHKWWQIDHCKSLLGRRIDISIWVCTWS